MGGFRGTHKHCAVFLALLLACHEVVLTHGRQIKPTLPNDTSSTEKKVEAAPTQKYEVAGSGDTNAFRPTTPGNSPGVGHRKFVREDKEAKTKVVVQSPDVEVEHLVTQGNKNDFRPTDPGHSPGVGNAFENEFGHR